MSEKATGRRHEHDLAAVALGQHLLGAGARHQPGLGDVGIHHVEEARRRHVDDLGDIVLARGDDEDVDAAEALHAGGDDLVAAFLGRGAQVEPFDLGAELAALVAHRVEFRLLAGGEHELAARTRQHLGSERAEGARRPGDDGDLALHVEERGRVRKEVVAHGFTPGG